MQAILVDFGGKIDCRVKMDVFAAVHVETPSFAYHCVLHGADERPATAVTSMLKQYDSTVSLAARVRCKKSSSTYCVELVDTRNGRDMKLSDLLLAATSAQVPPAADIASASVEYVYVTSVMGDGEFFGQLAKYDSESLDQFRSRLTEFYSVNRIATIDNPRAGDFCCCQYDVDALYYRARIVRKFAANKYVVSVCRNAYCLLSTDFSSPYYQLTYGIVGD